MRRFDRSSRSGSAPGRATGAVLAIAAACMLACGGRSGDGAGAPEPVDPAQALYNQGKYAEALPLLEKSAAAGKTGTLLYQIGFAKGTADATTAATVRHPYWTEARPLLEKEIASPGGATLDRLYYLTVIAFDDADLEGMKKYARQAVDTIEKGEMAQLDGEDWFRLGRLHDFLQEPSEAEAAYRRALSAFRKVPALNPTYQALTLVRVADLEYEAKRYDDALEMYDEARAITPETDQIRPFRYGLALLVNGRFDDAIASFRLDRDPETVTEAQYASDLAGKAKAVGGLSKADIDGTPIGGMPLEGLEARLKESGKAFKAVREKYSFRAGDPLNAEMTDQQKRFVSLLAERLAQTEELQEFCLKEGIAELVRR